MHTVYWIPTIVSSFLLALSAFTYFFHKGTIAGVAALGFPGFFRIELGVLQFLGAVVLILPGCPIIMKEWAYAGAALFYVTAIVAHSAHGDSHAITVANVVMFAILLVSRYSLQHSQIS